jgi:hypothetical protein
MSGPIYYQPNPPSSRQSWSGVLVLACLAIGLLAAMLEMERSRANSERDYARATSTTYVLQQARLEDLGKNLADQNTRIVRLQSLGNAQSGSAALALNQNLRWGALFYDALAPLDGGKPYEIWAVGPSGTATELSGVAPEPGISVYPFSWTIDPGPISRIEINSGDRAAGAALIFNGSIQ